MGRIQGTAVATFSNSVPVTLHGEWNISIAIPRFSSYGQGNGTPGSGYNGSALGTKQTVSGSFKFVVDQTGENIKQAIQTGQYSFFTIDWPLGDPNLGASKGKVIDAHFDTLDFQVDNPEGKYIISGSMTGGYISGEAFQPPPV